MTSRPPATGDKDIPSAPEAPVSRPPGLAGLLAGLPGPVRIAVPVAVVGAVVLAVVALQRSGQRSGTSDLSGVAEYGPLDARPPAKGEPAPDFALPSLDGETVRLSSLRGRPVIVNFWATWCGPCRAEMPDLEAAYAAANGDLVVLAVNSEGTPADLARRLSRDFRDELNLTFPIVLDSADNDVFNQYRLRGMPDTFFIDRDGIVRDVVIGPLNRRALEEKLSGLLGK